MYLDCFAKGVAYGAGTFTGILLVLCAIGKFSILDKNNDKNAE